MRCPARNAMHLSQEGEVRLTKGNIAFYMLQQFAVIITQSVTEWTRKQPTRAGLNCSAVQCPRSNVQCAMCSSVDCGTWDGVEAVVSSVRAFIKGLENFCGVSTLHSEFFSGFPGEDRSSASGMSCTCMGWAVSEILACPHSPRSRNPQPTARNPRGGGEGVGGLKISDVPEILLPCHSRENRE